MAQSVFVYAECAFRDISNKIYIHDTYEPVRAKGGQSVFWSILRFCHN